MSHCETHCHRRNPPLNSVAEEATRANVLAAAPAAANPVLATHDLRKETFHVVGAGKVVTVAAMVAEYLIAVPQVL
jgi:hypothetical protein